MQPVRVLCDRKAVVLIHRVRSVIVRTILLITKTSVHSLSNQARLPAELKHISKRRKRN